MNDNERENLVGWGQAAAAYAIFKTSDHPVSEAILVNGIIEQEHTRYVVAQRTGDNRLAQRAGAMAGLRVQAWNYLVLGVAAVLLLAPVIVSMNMGTDGNRPSPGMFYFIWLPLVGYVCWWLLRKRGDSVAANAHARSEGGLPPEREMNRSGYYEVEPDVWFNPVTERVLLGHAYSKAEHVQGRVAYRTESQQIRSLYKQMKSGQQPTPPQPRPFQGKVVVRTMPDGTVKRWVE